MTTLLRIERRGGISSADFSSGIVAGVVVLALVAVTAARAQEDARDLPYVSAVVNEALETARTNVEIPWSNPETGHGGTIRITETYYRDAGTPCRDYRRTLERPGAPAAVTTGTGCRVGAGRWELTERTAVEAAAPSAPAPAAAPPEPTAREAPARDTAAVCPDPAPAGIEPPETVVLPAGKPPAFVAYTLPSRTSL